MQGNKSPGPVSRRYLLATAGALGAAAATVGIVTAVSDSPSGSASSTPADDPVADHVPDTADGPIVVHVADLSHGTLDIFAGTAHIQKRDRDLAVRLARAAATA